MTNINYTEAQENQIRELSPITYDIAVELGETFGKKLRSVIAKACSMEGVEYVARERVAKNGNPTVSKVQIVDNIAEVLYSESLHPSLMRLNLHGLEKATKSSIANLLEDLRETNDIR